MKKLQINHNSEFELDLASLLAVIMKLVPVLLLSSAFVQMMVIETDLPQVVTEAIQKQEKEKKKNVLVEINTDRKIVITIDDDGKRTATSVEAKSGTIDFEKLHLTLRELKRQHPDVFKIDLSPAGEVAYSEVIKVMDEARRSRDLNIRFPIKDEKTGQDTTTDYMFPEIIFVNMMEG
jgi:biopolymer transport protein ExbD